MGYPSYGTSSSIGKELVSCSAFPFEKIKTLDLKKLLLDEVQWRFQIFHWVHNTTPNNAFILLDGNFDAIKGKDELDQLGSPMDIPLEKKTGNR